MEEDAVFNDLTHFYWQNTNVIKNNNKSYDINEKQCTTYILNTI